MNFSELLARAWHGAWIIGACGLIGLVLAFTYLAISPPTFVAQMIVAPPAQGPSQGAQLGQTISALGFGGLLGRADPESFQMYENLIFSQAVAERIEKRHHVMQVLFASRWDPAQKRWRERTGLAATARGWLYGILGRSTGPATPSVQDLTSYIKARLRIDSPAVNSPIRIITFASNDPDFAAHMLRWLHDETDGIVRENIRRRTTKMIEYLTRDLPSVTNSDERYALTQVLVGQEQNLMLLTVSFDYSATVLDPPVPPVSSTPGIGITLITSLFVGLGLGTLIAMALPASRLEWLKRLPRRIIALVLRTPEPATALQRRSLGSGTQEHYDG